MNNFFKKYWSHILNIFYMVIIDCFMGICVYAASNEGIMEGAALVIFPVVLFVEFILSILIFGEMIYAIVMAAKDKELKNKALHIIGAYFFNIFYIPCFLLTFVHKDSKSLIKNIAYLAIEIGLFIVLIIYTCMFVTAVI